MPVWTHEKQRSFLLTPNAYLCGSFCLTQRGCSVSLAPVTPKLFRTAPGFVLVPSDPVEVGSLQNVPGAGSRRGMSAALPPPALIDWHFWFGAEPGEWTEGFDSWEIFCLTDLEDSCAKKETLPCRNAESQPVFFSTDCLPQLCFTELHPASMTNNKSNRLKNLCGLHPAALSSSPGPRDLLAFVKSPSVHENKLPVAGDFRFCNWMSWLANIYWVLMIRPAPFYAGYVRDRENILFPCFQPSWFWLPGFEVKYPPFSFLLLGGLCLPFLSLFAVFAKVIAVTKLLAFCI